MKLAQWIKNRKNLSIILVFALIALNVFLVVEFGNRQPQAQLGLSGQVSNVTNLDSEKRTESAQADLSVELSAEPLDTAATSVDYALVLANSGPSRAEATVKLPANSDLSYNQVSRSSDPNFTCKEDSASGDIYCNMTLEPGQTANNGIWYDLGNAGGASSTSGTSYDFGTVGGGFDGITQTATISSDLRDSNPKNNTSEWTITLENQDAAQEVDLSIESSGPTSATSGGRLEWPLILPYSGDSRITAAITLPAHPDLTFNRVGKSSDPNFNCSEERASGDLICNITLEPGQTATAGIWYDLGNVGKITLEQTAAISSELRDPDMSNNTYEWRVEVLE